MHVLAVSGTLWFIKGLRCFPRHGVITPLTFKLRATTEKIIVEKPIYNLLPDLGIEPSTSLVALATASTWVAKGL